MSDPNALPALLAREAQALRELRAVLGAELNALRDRDAAAIEHTAADKRRLADDLDALERQRTAVLARLGVPETRFEAWLDAAGNDGLREAWQGLKALAAACERDNQRNGIVLQGNRRQAQAALALLRGGQSTPQVYTPAGATLPSALSKTLARA